jgi:hypothetical protein
LALEKQSTACGKEAEHDVGSLYYLNSVLLSFFYVAENKYTNHENLTVAVNVSANKLS